MFAAFGLVLLAIAAVLKLVNHNPDAREWLIIAGAALACIELIWGWRRAGPGYYRRGAP